MKEADDNYACSLELKGGYHGHPYPQKFVKAPLSQHPSKAPSSGKETPHSEAMRISMGK
jgi:hypothetical protein